MPATAFSILAPVFFHASSPVEINPDINADTLGSCIARTGAVDLSSVLFLENRTIDWTSYAGPIRVTLRGQSVSIQLTQAPDGDTYVRNIGSLVSRGEDRADLYLKLALVNNTPVVYWRETFQHRIYRQGIFSIVGFGLVPLCEGEGGETILS